METLLSHTITVKTDYVQGTPLNPNFTHHIFIEGQALLVFKTEGLQQI